MDSSRRGVEAYWRSRMIDGVTADEDKIAPVYKLEEVCELLRTSHASIVKEVSEFILKRLDHKSPIVKQKTLRLIKYTVGKSGAEFRKEMQRNSASLRQLVHYKGNLDPLKGDALNKAVRTTAQEAISSIFSSDDNNATVPVDSINKRIEGFGNTNYEMPTEEKKSFLSEVVGLGSASIIQGLTSLAVSHSLKKNDSGTYRSPNLRKSLTTEVDGRDSYEPVDERHGDSWQSSGSSRSAASGSLNPDPRNSIISASASEVNNSSHAAIRSREERLLETVVTSGGMRLQPTRDTLQAFLSEASKLDPLAMSRVIETKLQSHLWQVRMKAICVLEAILRKKDDDYCSIIESYFSDNTDTVVKCCELPQASLREKANKVLSLLGGEQHSAAGNEEDPTDVKSKPVPAVPLPDLIDTFNLDEDESTTYTKTYVDQDIEDSTSASPLIDDLLGGAPILDATINKTENGDDPFADVSFHVSSEKHTDIFSGLMVDDKKPDQTAYAINKPESFDIFGLNSVHAQDDKKKEVHDLMPGLSPSGMNQDNLQIGALGIDFHGSSQQSQPLHRGNLNGILGSNAFYPMASMQYGLPPNIMFNPTIAAQSMHYGAMGAFITQHQLLYQNFGNINSGYGNAPGISTDGGYGSALPDIFQISNSQVQNHSTARNAIMRDDTKAFDFISEHMSAARDSKRIG
ncbi:VHS domain-containing protein [Platanthera guangdongensis]|uniref:VHS domain-containing protein n=1 Tax=Platanthera guangdongensis TaxID=2320717 RepID=A0ABR2N4M1_9ASPA